MSTFSSAEQFSKDELFLYHCFPRRQASSSEFGLRVLESILRWGLALVPEVRSLPSGNSFSQVRISFAALAPDELSKHAANFGSFALEYDLGDLRSLGALPVFYLPGPSVNQTNNLGGVGLVLTNRIIETWVVLRRLVALDQFRNEHPDHVDTPVNRALNQLLEGVTELRQLEFTAQALLNLLYPTEDPQYNGPLSYYHQREWKLIPNFAIGTRWDVASATPEQIDYLITLDSDFFGEPLPETGRPRAHSCMFFRQLLDESVLTKARRLIVPDDADQATALVTRYHPQLKVVARSSLAQTSPVRHRSLLAISLALMTFGFGFMCGHSSKVHSGALLDAIRKGWADPLAKSCHPHSLS